jgi:hypothetical protein
MALLRPMFVGALGVVAAALLVLPSCSPEVGDGAYFCGPERLCPGALVCDGPTFTCVQPSHVEAFACPGGADEHEPDGDPPSAWAIEGFLCGQAILDEGAGCIGSAGDVDLVSFTGEACVGDDPHVLVSLSFPIAYVPLAVEIRDAGGALLASGTPCTPVVNYSGMDSVCMELEVEAGAVYYVRVTPAAGAPDCDGACALTLYQLTIQSLLT